MAKLRIPTPSEKQKLFFSDKHPYIAYGGARGGGKSWAVRVKAILLALRYPGIIIMIIRRSYPELRANHIEPMRKMLGKRFARYNDSKKEYAFRNGSTILFRYCAKEADMDNYQGTEADVIFIDEATHFEEKVFRMFVACLRGVNSFPKRVYLTCNPGGKGHAWVKRLFIDRRYKDDEDPAEYSFIQALVQDNDALMKSQPKYIKQLEALPPKLRDAWLHGRWDIFEGQFFEEFSDNPRGYEERVLTHVIPAFNPPKTWKRYRSFDFGYAKPFSCGWWAVDHDGVMYRILELYGCTATPDEGVKWPVPKIFDEIARIEREHPYLKGYYIEGVADPSIWQENGGVSIAEIASDKGVYFRKGDNSRIPGWMQMHYRMAFDENGHPMMYVFDCCKGFIRTIPTLVYSENKPEDLDTKQEDHIADECRYMCMLNPIAPRESVLQPPIKYDPLDLWKDERANDKYAFYRL